MSLRKRQRSASSSRLATLSSPSSPPRAASSSSPPLSFPNADLLLRLLLDTPADDDDYHPAPAAFLDLHVCFASLNRSRYFAALLSVRWCPHPSSSPVGRLSLAVPVSSSCSHPKEEEARVLDLAPLLPTICAVPNQPTGRKTKSGTNTIRPVPYLGPISTGRTLIGSCRNFRATDRPREKRPLRPAIIPSLATLLFSDSTAPTDLTLAAASSPTPASMEAEITEEVKPPRMNRRQWKASRGNREDKWTKKYRLLREANAEKHREQLAAEAAEMEAEAAASREDPEAAIARRYRESWIRTFSRFRGSYEDTTSIPPMRYTDELPPTSTRVGYADAVVVFSVKVTQLDDCLEWPLDVYGIVAARDSVDRNRNIIFNRTRDNCQKLTPEDASLSLTGPTRAIVIIDPVNYEVELKVKGDTPSQDKLLSLLLIEDKYYLTSERCQGVHRHTYSSKLSTVEVIVGHLAQTVEATITVQVVEGSWTARHHGRFAACMAGLSDLEMELLDGMVTITSNGAIELSRRVVSVEADGGLKLLVHAWQGDDRANVVGKGHVIFAPGRAGRSEDTCDVGFCKMRVTVAWSLVVNW